MKKLKLFIENFLAYGLVNILNKIVPLIMLPILAKILKDTADFGVFDMFITIINFGSAFAVLGVYDSMFREYFEKDSEDYKAKVTSSAMVIVFIASMIVMFFMILFRAAFSKIFFGNYNCINIVIMSAVGIFFMANRNIISAPTRIQNKRKIYVVSGLLNSLGYYLLAIYLLQKGFGYNGMIYANLIASIIIFAFFLKINYKHFSFKKYDKPVAKELLRVGLPTLPVFLIYWVFSSFDKIIIMNVLGAGQQGIYSMGLRVASVSQLIYSAFAGGWQYFAFSTMKDDDQVGMTSKIFEYLGVISLIMFAIVTPMSNWVFQLFFSGDFEKAGVVFPYLFLSPLLLMVFQVASNQLLVVKKTYMITGSLCIGVIVNVVLNYVLIDKFGIKGCSAATLIGYIVSVILIVAITTKMDLLKIKGRFGIVSLIAAISTFLLFIGNNYYIIGMIAVCISTIVLYMPDFKNLILLIKNRK
ncbi:oligosaccharide flippase family protein [Anaerosacchariphilus polymeriproducens]|uniref:Polysaccharide biosynthesis protein n=1 Tax=Anaerosacchariphilus polymeriproducens TaxID=1812858 RepID=A0A371ARG1_9FIRM|nr:oligosaccharide flippase family protein [Anaerosacchariphilus polymeriproducens]RDU22122.1 polysaccharide biosynthesis protein [Anaerosacchariphilus polymeriproducens]